MRSFADVLGVHVDLDLRYSADRKHLPLVAIRKTA
jgi:hypothetical protein